MSRKDLQAAERMMDRTKANRIAKQNGGGGFFASIGCGVIALVIFGSVGTGLVAIVQHFV